MREILANIMTPAQAISLDVAVTSMFPGEIVSCRIVSAWPGLPELQKEIGAVLLAMLATSSHHYTLVPEIDPTFSKNEFTHFFYAHDVVGNTVQSLCLAFPRAVRVCIGDALGMVCDRDFHVGLIVNGTRPSPRKMIEARVRRIFKTLVRRRKVLPNESIIPDRASLILPVDQTGWSLFGVPVFVPQREIVLQILNRMAESLPKLQEFIDDLLLQVPSSPVFVLLMENLAEGGTISFEKEAEMYATIIREAAPVGTRVLIKGHPGETIDREPALRALLGDHCQLSSVPCSLKRIPFELWTKLITRSTIISLSYPSLSIEYLFGKRVVNPASDSFIEKWWVPHFWETYKDSLKLYKAPLANLSGWNRRGLLAKGPF
jgi:hypothetical protein